MVKIKINNLTISLRKATGYTQENSHKVIGWLFSRNFAGHKEKHIIFKVLREKQKHSQKYCLTSLPFKIVGEIGSQ